MMMDAEKDGKPLPMVGGKADARDTMRQLALVVSMLSHFVDLNSLWIWYELQKNRSVFSTRDNDKLLQRLFEEGTGFLRLLHFAQ